MAIKKLADVEGIPKKYKKKPIIIQAVELIDDVVIDTREGQLVGYAGDYLIEGIEGEIYPCGKDIFHKTYEEVKK